MAITAKDVQSLRERTGVGMMDCKKALEAAGGDVDKAIEILREKGLAAAAKKAGRIASEGIVYAYVDEARKAGVVLEVNSETDFVAKNDSFRDFVTEVAQVIVDKAPADVDALLALSVGGKTVQEKVQEKVLTIGENIKIRRFERLEGDLATYIHGGGRIGVIVKFDTDCTAKPEFAEYGKDIAMQVAAMNPKYLDRAAVPAEALDEEKKVLKAQVVAEGKPENIAEKIVMGRLGKFYKENCLLEQEFIKDGELDVAKYTAETAKKLGGKIAVSKFVRYEKGEGLAKREDNLAAEVAGMIK
jgi:elongation factor Ts